jgi:cyclin-dependent kinase-like
MTDYVATRWYRPPELLVGANYGTPIDIWAVGCIIAELSNTQPLFPGSDDVDQLALIVAKLGHLPDSLMRALHCHPSFQNMVLPTTPTKEEHFDQLKPKLTENGVDLLRHMLKLDPTQRITASEALRHPYFDIIKSTKHRPQETEDNWFTKGKLKTKLASSETYRNLKSM